MRIETNFGPRQLALVPWLLGGMVLAGVVLLTATAILAIDGVEARSAIPAARERLGKVEERLAAERQPVEFPTREQLGTLRTRVVALNSVGVGRGLSAGGLLAKLEGLLPDAAQIVSLHQRRHDGTTALLVEAPTVDPLATFLNKLEKDSTFVEVQLVRQSAAGNRSGVQFELRLKERAG